MEPVRESLETGTFFTERTWTVEGIPVLTARITLPQPTETVTRLTRRIRRYYRTQARAYLRYCERQLFPMAATAYRTARENSTPLPDLTAELICCVTCNEGGFWSLYTQSREPSEDGRMMVRRWGDTWDLRTGYPVPLSHFFAAHSGWKRRLLALAAKEIQRQEDGGCAQYLPGWRRRLRRYFNTMNFYLTPEGLAFFYPMYAIAPAVEGIPVFLCPWKDTSKHRTAEATPRDTGGGQPPEPV